MYKVVGVVKRFLPDTSSLASRERGQGRPAKRGVHRRPLKPRGRLARLNWPRSLALFAGLRLTCRIPLWLSTKARLFESYGESYSTNHVFDLRLQTMIRSPNSPFSCQGRQGAQSTSRWSFLHHRASRATLHASRRHRLSCFAPLPVQPHRQLSCDGHFRHPTMATAELQSLIVPPQFRIEPGGCLGGFGEPVTHHRVALLTDRPQPLPTSATLLTRIQPQITHPLLAPPKALHRADRQYKRQCRHRPYAWLLHQADSFRTVFGFLDHRLIQRGDPGVELVEPLEQLLPTTAGPRIQWEAFQFLAACPRPQLLFPAKALPHGQAVQLVHHRGSIANQLVPMPQHLPDVPLGRWGNPDPREAMGEQQIKYVEGIPRVCFLLAHHRRTDLGRVSNPKFVLRGLKCFLEPLGVDRGFHPHTSWAGKGGVKLLGFPVLVF